MAMKAKTCTGLISAAAFMAVSGAAHAASCGNNAGGFEGWKAEFRQEAAANGVGKRALSALDGTQYASKTIQLDRNQKSFKYSLDKFMQVRGANTIISKGKSLKKQNAKLFANLERKYGVTAGPLIAIWGMETGFGAFMGNQHTLSAVATLAYDCRRSAYFTEQLYALLRLIDRGTISASAKGAAHGEIGQTQFLPANVLKYGADGDGNGSVDMVRSKADALASTARFLAAHGFSPNYQPGQAGFGALQGWNAAGVYQKAIAIIGAEIDGS
jgi:lytic murein transglycosylase